MNKNTKEMNNTPSREELNNAYLDLLGRDNLIAAVQDAVTKVNELYGIINNTHLSYLQPGELPGILVSHQQQGRIVESAFARNRNINGFCFHQGDEHANEKDAECHAAPISLEDRYSSLIGDTKDPHRYGIEMKTTSMAWPSGNKAVASGTNISQRSIKQDRDSFYLFLTRIQSGIGTHHLEITNYNIYFGFLRQDDWVGGSNGAWSGVSKEAKASMIRLI